MPLAESFEKAPSAFKMLDTGHPYCLSSLEVSHLRVFREATTAAYALQLIAALQQARLMARSRSLVECLELTAQVSTYCTLDPLLRLRP